MPPPTLNSEEPAMVRRVLIVDTMQWMLSSLRYLMIASHNYLHYVIICVLRSLLLVGLMSGDGICILIRRKML